MPQRAIGQAALWLTVFFSYALPAFGHAQRAQLSEQAPPSLPDELARQAAMSPTWLALVHMGSGRPSITDPGFLLSAPHPSAIGELRATVAALYGNDSSAVCRFPARYLWLRERLSLPALGLAECQDYTEFLVRAPAENVSLVFVSESLSQPSSSMGHLFLKLSGTTSAGTEVAHAISFYTDTATLNIPKLFWDSLVTGKRGLFALTPYQEQVDEYVYREHRNLWEYPLRLAPFQHDLLLAHIIELKQTTLIYYFQAFNCATLVQQILAVGAPSLLSSTGVWSTPRSVLRVSRHAGLLKDAGVIPTARWTTREIERSISAEQAARVRSLVDAAAVDDQKLPSGTAERAKALSLARAYNDYLKEFRDRSEATWAESATQIMHIEAAANSIVDLRAPAVADPSTSPPESQFFGGFSRIAASNALRVGFVPVSHGLGDDNRHYGNETEFKLGEVALLHDLERHTTQLDRITLYSVASLLPRDGLTGGLSGSFRVGMERRWTPALEYRGIGYVEGTLGVTKRVLDSVDFFALVGGGFAYADNANLYPRISAGVVIRERLSMKSTISAGCVHGDFTPRQTICQGSWEQAAYIAPQISVVGGLSQIRSGATHSAEWHVEIRHLL